MTEPIYHLAQRSDWARSTSTYEPPSVESEGFVHCSTPTQLPGVARRFFDGQNDLILLTIDPATALDNLERPEFICTSDHRRSGMFVMAARPRAD